MQVGCYTLDLYCDNAKQWPDDLGHDYGEFPWSYTGELGSKCRAKARKAGWKLLPDGGAICPKCNKRSNKNSSTPLSHNTEG